jgi:hypothetical protein
MKQTLLGLSVLFISVIVGLPGCGRTAPPGSGVKVKNSTAQTDPFKSALDLLRQATEVGHYREALHQMNAHLSKGTSKQVTPLTAEEKDALGKLYRLNPGEMAELDGSLFRPLDACHLESCGLFRDAARMLEIANVPPLEQARICFDWVMRRVQLHEQGDVGLPPAFVLRRGYGSGLDRALVFLALLQQFQIEGCLLTPTDRPSDASGPILAGVLLVQDKTPTLALFDPRLGQSVPGPNPSGIATFAEVRATPDLLKLSAIPADAIVKLEIYQIGPLEALSARMRYLQNKLVYQDKTILFQDALGVCRDLAKVAGHDVAAWDAPTPKGPSPARALQLFLGSENGGIDVSGRLQRFKTRQIAWPAILQHFQEMRLIHTKDINEQARDILLRKCEELYTLYSVQPGEYFLHGQFELAHKRLDRMRTVLETEEAAKPLEEAAFQKRLDAWRARVFEAYLSLVVRKEAGGQGKVDALWNEDQYLLNVLHPDSDFPLERFEKKMLSLIVLNACREPLGQQVNYLIASSLHETAAKLQATQTLLEGAGKDTTNIKVDVDFAWRNARRAWNKYLEHYLFSPQSVPKRLVEIQQRWNGGDLEYALNLWEQLHLDVHTNIEARLRLSEAQQRLQGSSPALQDLLTDLSAIQKSDLPKNLSEFQEKVRANKVAAQRLELLARDWAPQGNIHWLHETARLRMEKEKSSRRAD